MDKKITEAIILAGGLGTRLQSVLPNKPKCLADINGKPFIQIVIEYYRKQGIEKFVLSLGFKAQMVVDALQNQNDLEFIIENEQLGTGGAIQFALAKCKTTNILILNGDSLFFVDVSKMVEQYFLKDYLACLALKTMNNFERYGVVLLNENNEIIEFKEKQFQKSGLINGGVYIINKASFIELNLPNKFSLENDFFVKLNHLKLFCGVTFNAYFIDIGIPEDYEKAKQELK